MNEPIQLLYLGTEVPDLGTSAYGPFVLHPLGSLDELSDALGQQASDAVVIAFDAADTLSTLSAWPALSRALLDTAMVIVAPEPDAAEALRLLRLGVQDVLPTREAGADALARSVRLAVERKRAERMARKAYATDLATGLPNHAQLMEHMTHLLALREREPAAMALLAVRLDGLAATEARLGAEAANVLRRKAAVRLRSGLRASDVVASVGGDTFAVLLAWIDDEGAADGVAAKLGAALRRPFSVAGQELSLSISVGVGQYPSQGKDADGLLRRALAHATGVAAVGASVHGLRSTERRDPAANDEL
ncbi:GGDEF domain-containing protein [Aquincola sp. S2]|uniref:GGDEF domain-containing protein n=1 Tax=Pseudaquabacterium terrae TaxID=2732868 RepID=A0ABX2EMB5_9BURK|nr:GGDEF domain-containing protein [Aquabacterium terrae]NRF69701.1 GGDEF domain-containing protein [Aquabacterium terrae]